MLFGLVDRTTIASPLKRSLDDVTQRVRGIQSRVARASLQGDGFALSSAAQGPTDPGDGINKPVDVEAEMSALADEQLRFEATAKLLEKAYASLRSASRDR